MKAIIPVAGAGTKLRPHTYTQPKALIPLAGKTILSIIVDQLREGGVSEFVFIIGYLGEKIRDYVTMHYPDLKCKFVPQADRHGIGHAIELTKNIVGQEEIIIVLGDTIAEYNVAEIVASKQSMLGIKKVDDPRLFGVAEIDDATGMISRMVEKPSIPKSNMALVGIYKIVETGIMFECLEIIESQKSRTYEEFSLTEALQCMVEKGVIFKPFKVENWFDCGRKESLIESNAILLKKFGAEDASNAHIQNSVIIPPVRIGAGCVIKNSLVGPNVTIGENTTIELSIVRNSIIGSYSAIEQLVLNNSLVGSDAEVKGVTRNLNIGDNTSIDLAGGS